jgi:hypothetical protein
MRLSLFRELSNEEQKKEVELAIKRIQKARKKLDRIGTWNKNVTKELKEKVEAILWTVNN